MTKLTKHEHDWIVNRLKVYEIKYTEIYNEVYDHMVSGIEQKRKQGDTRDISPIFQDIIDEDFGSYRGIERMTKERLKAVQHILSSALKQEFFSHFTFPRVLLFLGLTVLFAWMVSGVQLPERHILLALILLSFVPPSYIFFFEIKHRIFRNKSIVSGHMQLLTFQLVSLINVSLYLVPFTLLFFVEADDFDQSREMLFEFLGLSGMSILAMVIFIYIKSIAKIIRTDYKRMILSIEQGDPAKDKQD